MKNQNEQDCSLDENKCYGENQVFLKLQEIMTKLKISWKKKNTTLFISHFKFMHFSKTNKSGTIIHVHSERDSIPRLGYFPKQKNEQERNEKRQRWNLMRNLSHRSSFFTFLPPYSITQGRIQLEDKISRTSVGFGDRPRYFSSRD